MKKFFIIFLFMIVLSLSLVLPSFAVMIDSFGSYSNLFDPSDVVQARFYTSSSSYQDNNFYSVDLQANHTYTFISTQGSKSFYCGDPVIYNNYTSVFAYDSLNLIDIKASGTYTSNGVTFVISDDGTVTLSGTATSGVYFSIGTVNITESGNYYLLGTADFVPSWSTSLMYVQSDSSWYTSRENYMNKKFVNSSLTSNVFIYVTAGVNCDGLVYRPIIVREDLYNDFVPYYAEPSFNDDLTYVYTFTPSRSGNYLIGINDVLSGSITNQFSYNQSSQNEFYLVEGSLTPDQIADVLQQDQYNQGYTQGYKEGEFDGLNSTKFMNSTLLTAISAPFVIVSSALNFEIFGINFYHILQVLFTLLLVSFVVTKLKGRE